MAQALRVLLIEDSVDDAMLIEAELARDFLPLVKRVENEAELRAALDEPWDLVVSDYRLPQFNGLQALSLVRQSDADLPFILVSGAVGDELATQTMHAGANDFILKGNLARLCPSVRRSLLDVHDRRERGRAEAALHESERRFRVVAREAPFPMMIHAEDGEVLLVNQAWTESTGYAQDDIRRVGDWVEKAYSEAHRASVRKDIERLYGLTERMDEGEYVVRCNDGTEAIWSFSSSPLGRLADGRRAVVTMAIDVSERKRAEAREKRLANLYRALSEVNDAILHLDSESDLLPLICRIAVEYGGMSGAWVGTRDESRPSHSFARDGKTAAHFEEVLSKSIVLSLPQPARSGESQASQTGEGSEASRNGESDILVINDFSATAASAPWGSEVHRHGIRAAAVLPILRNGREYAVFAAYSDEQGAFDTEIVGLLNEIANNVSFALDNLDREAQRRQAEEELRLAALVYRESSEAMMVIDAANRIVSVNPAFTRITGYPAEDVQGKTPLVLGWGKQNHVTYRDVLARLMESHYWRGELWLKKRDGDDLAAAVTINTTFHPDGSVNRHVILVADITKKKETDEIIWHQANFDPLTGLPNRRHFLDQLTQEIKKARRADQEFALVFLDLDGFKYVNDTLGHDAGDVLLKETASRLVSCVRETDTVARIGGDEFTIILGEVRSARHVDTIVGAILSRLAEPFHFGSEVVYVSGSMGITLFPKDAEEVEDLLINADQAMYAAKASGKNRSRFFTEQMQQAAQERAWLVHELRAAIEHKQFRLVYQPIVEVATGRVTKVEALLRWAHPQRGFIDPAVFIPLAEETGMIHAIGDWVFFEAARQAAHLRKTYHPEFQVSVNKSPVQFKTRQGDVNFLFSYLRCLDLPGQAIAVEITEGVLMDESKAVTDQLIAFRDAGIEVSLDDFGTGYSALSYLKKFDIDRLKIDQSFVRNLETDAYDLALCEAMIVMAHKLGIKVIAEGVETEQQREMLAHAGCDFIQGYLLSTPVSAEELDEILSQGLFIVGVRPGDELPRTHQQVS